MQRPVDLRLHHHCQSSPKFPPTESPMKGGTCHSDGWNPLILSFVSCRKCRTALVLLRWLDDLSLKKLLFGQVQSSPTSVYFPTLGLCVCLSLRPPCSLSGLRSIQRRPSLFLVCCVQALWLASSSSSVFFFLFLHRWLSFAAMASQEHLEKLQARKSYRNFWHADLMRTIQVDTPCMVPFSASLWSHTWSFQKRKRM